MEQGTKRRVRHAGERNDWVDREWRTGRREWNEWNYWVGTTRNGAENEERLLRYGTENGTLAVRTERLSRYGTENGTAGLARNGERNKWVVTERRTGRLGRRGTRWSSRHGTKRTERLGRHGTGRTERRTKYEVRWEQRMERLGRNGTRCLGTNRERLDEWNRNRNDAPNAEPYSL